MKDFLFKNLLVIFISCFAISNGMAFEIYNSDAPLSDSAHTLPIVLKPSQLTDYGSINANDAELYQFVKKALIDVEITNGANFAFPNLELVFFIYGRSTGNQQVYLAGLGTYTCKIDRHQSLRYGTDALFFGKDKKNFLCLPEHQSGDQYYGYIMAAFNAKQLVGLYTHPRFLKKHQNDLYQIKTTQLYKNKSKRSTHCLTKKERKAEILRNRTLHF